jgi:zinc-ribbon domain
MSTSGFSPMKQCPSCASMVDSQSNACGYCGHDFTGQLATGENAGQSPYVQHVRSSMRWSLWLTTFIVLAVTGTIVAAFFFVGKEVDDTFDKVGLGNVEVGDALNPKELDTSAEGAFKGVKPLVAELNAKGVKCERTNVVVSNGTLESGTCFMGTDSLNVQVYFDKLSFDASVSSLEATQGKSLAFGRNWTVLAPTSPGTAKKVAKALGGQIGKP